MSHAQDKLSEWDGRFCTHYPRCIVDGIVDEDVWGQTCIRQEVRSASWLFDDCGIEVYDNDHLRLENHEFEDGVVREAVCVTKRSGLWLALAEKDYETLVFERVPRSGIVYTGIVHTRDVPMQPASAPEPAESEPVHIVSLVHGNEHIDIPIDSLGTGCLRELHDVGGRLVGGREGVIDLTNVMPYSVFCYLLRLTDATSTPYGPPKPADLRKCGVRSLADLSKVYLGH